MWNMKILHFQTISCYFQKRLNMHIVTTILSIHSIYSIRLSSLYCTEFNTFYFTICYDHAIFQHCRIQGYLQQNIKYTRNMKILQFKLSSSYLWKRQNTHIVTIIHCLKKVYPFIFAIIFPNVNQFK